MRALASLARSVGHTCGGGVLSVMPPSLSALPGARLGRFGTPRPATAGAGSQPATGSPWPDGLVVVPALGRQAGEHWLLRALRSLLQQPPGPVKSDNPGRGLRREPDLRAERGGQVPVAPAALRGQAGNGHAAAGVQQPPPGETNLGADLGTTVRRGEAAQQGP